MEYREFKDTGEKVSLLGFGCMRLPVVDGDDTKIDEAAALEMVDFAYKSGVNYFDAAYSYHGGTVERFIGGALSAYPRESWRLATKLPIWLVNSREDVARLFNEQLERCGVEYFDFYLVHALHAGAAPKIAQFGVWETLTGFKKEGKIRHLGFSFHDEPELLEQLCSDFTWDFAQIQLNYLDWERKRAKEQYEVLQNHGLPAIVMEPILGGRLANLGEEANAILHAAAPDSSMASFALRYAASLPGVLTVLSGMSAMPQLQDNLATFSAFQPLSNAERDAIAEALAIYRRGSFIPCTACRYCMPCPSGVDIPGMFAIYNEFVTDNVPFGMWQRYSRVPEGQNASACVACGACEAACPQHIKIISWLEKVKLTNQHD